MYLSRLEIYGFKSFASKSVLDFNDGKSKSQITAVVGPNGSGKSNVADCIRWVLGEQSSKLLRSKKNEDVIFGGSASKSKGSYAEISMVLADTKSFNVEINNKKYDFNEIEIGRKLYRSGESEYLVNHKKVRLIDLQQLLASLGFGQSSYTVIGQGMVDRLLFFNAAERKVLFDEAAGVKQYEIKREQAIKKLESTAGNLIRLEDILTELEPRVVNLRRLVKKAEGRKEIEGELKESEERYYGSVIFEYQTKVSQLKSDIAELNKKVEQKNELIQRINSEIDKAKSVNQNNDSINVIETELNTATSERDGLLREVAFLEAKINQKEQSIINAIREKDALSLEQVTLSQKVSFLEEKLKTGKDSISIIEAEKEIVQSRLDSLLSEKKVINDKLSTISSEINNAELEKTKVMLNEAEETKLEINNKIFSIRNEINNFERDRIRQEDSKKNILDQISSYKSELTKIKEEVAEFKRKIDQLSKEDAQVKVKIENSFKKIVTAEKAIADNFEFRIEEIEDFEAEIDKAALDLAKIKSNNDKDLLKGFWEKVELIFSRARKLTNVLNSKKRKDFEGKLTDLKEENRLLLDEQNRIALELSKLENESLYKNQRVDSLTSQIKKLEDELANCKVIKEKATSDELARLESDLNSVNLEIAKLTAKVQDSSKSFAEKQHKILSQKNIIQEKETEIRQEIYELEIEISKKKSLFENQQREFDSTKSRLSEIKERLANTVVEQNDDKDSIEIKEKRIKLEEKNSFLITLRAKLSEAIAAQRSESSVVLEKEREKHSAEIEISEIKDKINEIQLEKAKVETRLEDVLAEIKLFEITLNNSFEEVFTQPEKDILRAKIENLKRKLDTIGGVDPETVSEYEELQQRNKEMAEQVDDLSKAKNDLEKVVKQLDEQIKNQFNSAFQHIAKEFNRYFEILFDGGKANLSLGEDEEGNYGIEISANPPGKRVNSLNALSGGERTLTSLALLFAILSINPSPFCVLDEVDAALDESNTVRFSEILNTLSKKTQFIVISHNRNTMKAADTLYGVTMDNDHVSKLISVRLTEALEAVK